ncbi:MAG: LTA synthase family protein [Pseudohongiella sp.]|nr:LTA synthase family protein [Pseudohongiella sp.]MDP2128442.1 LTA synthase family protein [Pseudohongiella sp.]
MTLRTSLRKWTGNYYPLIIMMLCLLAILSLSRLMLAGWQWERIDAAVSVWHLFSQGLRADLILAGLWLAVPVLLAPVWAQQRFSRSWLMFCYLWAMLALSLSIFIELASPQFILEYDVRPNRLYLEYLRYPKEVISMLWEGYRMVVALAVASTAALIWLMHKMINQARLSAVAFSNKILWLSWPLVVFLVFAAVRSTTDHRPANPAMFASTGDPLVNSLIISSPYSVLYALYSLSYESGSSDIYGTMTDSDMISAALDWPWLKDLVFSSAEFPTLHYHEASLPRAKPLNLVIVLEESLGATYVESLGGLSVTPELERLSTQGWWFEQMFATGTRSVRGIEAIVSGFMPTPAQSVLKLSLAQQNFYTLASTLKQQGYSTSFVYGGEAHFDNMRSFLTGNHFEQVIDLAQMPEAQFVGSWGASDEDLFNTTEKHLLAQHISGEPFFSFVFTSSNHTPFEYPDGRIQHFDEPAATVNNAVKYADFSVGQFIEHARQQPYWENTVFLIVADHDNRVFGNELVPVSKFHIPALILGADIQPQKISSVASQIDLAPTLLSLIGISAQTPLIGRDFTRDSYSQGRALMQFEQNFALLEGTDLTILRPEQAPVAGSYDPISKTVTTLPALPSDARVRRALAQVLLPAFLYQRQLYRVPETSDSPEPAT